jgi:MOSC domain-containing protein YiiM
VPERRLRPNLVLQTGRPAGPAEDAWIGRTARIGHSAVVEFTHRTERCVMINNAQDGLAHSSQVLRAVAGENDMMLGVYAKIIRPGTVRVGDEMVLMDGLLK